MKTLSFTKLPHVLLDLGAAEAIGYIPFIVYIFIRRYTWRRNESGSAKVDRLRAKGRVVARVNQMQVARRIGISRSSMMRAVNVLRAAGWVKKIKLERNRRGFIIGDTKETGSRKVEQLYADLFMVQFDKELRYRRKTGERINDETRSKLLKSYLREDAAGR